MIKINGQLILEEDEDENNRQPAVDEIKEYATFLGIMPDTEPHLMWIAREGLKAPLPENWKPCQNEDNDIYYFNFATGETIWDHPCDVIYNKKVMEERTRYQQGREAILRKNDVPTNQEMKQPTKLVANQPAEKSVNKLAKQANKPTKDMANLKEKSTKHSGKPSGPDMLKKKAVPSKQTSGKQVAIQPTKKATSQPTKQVSSQPNKQTKTTVNPKVKLAKPDVNSSTKPSDKPTDSVEHDDKPEDTPDSTSSKPMEASGRPESPATQPSGGQEKIFMDAQNWTWSNTIRAQFSGNMHSSEVTGCCFMPNGEFVICDKPNQLVKSYDKVFTNKGSVFLPVAPFDVAAIDKRSAVVTMPRQKKLHLIQVLPSIQKGGTIAVDKECWGVDVADDLIYVSCYTLGSEDGEVRIYTTIGNMMKSFFIYGVGSHNLKQLDYIGVSRSGDKIFVSDSVTNTVMCVTEDKKLVYEFQDPELLSPKGIYVDDNDNVIVCGKDSANVHVITSGAKQHKVLASTMHFTPLSVTFRPSTKKLIVGLEKEEEMMYFTLY